MEITKERLERMYITKHFSRKLMCDLLNVGMPKLDALLTLHGIPIHKEKSGATFRTLLSRTIDKTTI